MKNYYAIITQDVLHDEELTSTSKLIYAEITSLTCKEGYCWASNYYIAKQFKINERTVVRSINQLISKGYLIKKVIYKDNKEVEGRLLFIKEGGDKNVTRWCQKCHDGGDKNVTYNNKKFNNKKIIYDTSEMEVEEVNLEEMRKRIFNEG